MKITTHCLLSISITILVVIKPNVFTDPLMQTVFMAILISNIFNLPFTSHPVHYSSFHSSYTLVLGED